MAVKQSVPATACSSTRRPKAPEAPSTAHRRLNQAYSNNNPTDTEALLAFNTAAARLEEVCAPVRALSLRPASTTSEYTPALPSETDFALDVERAAQQCLPKHHFVLFRASYIKGTLNADRIPAAHIRQIELTVGRELLKRGIVSQDLTPPTELTAQRTVHHVTAKGQVHHVQRTRHRSVLANYFHKRSVVVAEQLEKYEAEKRKKRKELNMSERRLSNRPALIDEGGVRRMWLAVLELAIADMQTERLRYDASQFCHFGFRCLFRVHRR